VGALGTHQVALVVLSALLSVCVGAAAVPLAGPRWALACGLGSLVLLNTIRVPVGQSVPYRWRQALYRSDQTVEQRVPLPTQALNAPALRILVEPHLATQPPPFQLETSTPDRTQRWACPFAAGQQWLLLPLPGLPAADGDAVPVGLRLVGQPSRERGYLVVFAENEASGFLIQLADASQPDPTAVRCDPTSG
jgi:hypothetical protein